MREWLIDARVKLGWDTCTVAYYLQVSENAVRQWEKGVRTPNRSHQLRLAQLMGQPELAAKFDAELTQGHHKAAFVALAQGA